jgi:hypothetical protein
MLVTMANKIQQLQGFPSSVPSTRNKKIRKDLKI